MYSTLVRTTSREGRRRFEPSVLLWMRYGSGRLTPGASRLTVVTDLGTDPNEDDVTAIIALAVLNRCFPFISSSPAARNPRRTMQIAVLPEGGPQYLYLRSDVV